MMAGKTLNRKNKNPYLPVFTGTRYEETLQIQQFRYNQDNFDEKIDFNIDDFTGFKDQKSRYWLNIHGIHDVEKIIDLSGKLGLHNLVIQDILDVNQRPKFQEYDNYCFFSIKSILPGENLEIQTEQLSFILGSNYLVSFQEKKADYFEHLRNRIRENIGILRQRSSDYLLYLLLESILDNYFKTIDEIEKHSEEFEFIDIKSDPSPSSLKTIELLKRNIHLIKKTVTPIWEFVNKIERQESSLIDKKHLKYFLELKDLCLMLLDSCENIGIRLDSSINLFFSVQGHRMNQVMKTLTVVASVFIPLTFIAGIYGMNFTNMPELGWKWGYFAVWLIIISVVIVMMIYFKRKKWF